MKPSVRLLAITQPMDGLILETPLDLIEYAGRWDYGATSVAKMGPRATKDGLVHNEIIGRWLASGEESMVEMVDAVFMIECSRVVSHELVRHRIASYQQESQRFVKYDQETHEDLFYVPPEIEAAGEGAVIKYLDAVGHAHQAYLELKSAYGISSQIARYVLPNATRTRIIAKMNLREWRHVLRLRMHTSAQPEMRDIAEQIYRHLLLEFGTVLFPPDLADVRGTR